MPDALRRGSVVLRGRRYGVVWAVDAAGALGRSSASPILELLPILRPNRPWAHDVALDLSDLVACVGPKGPPDGVRLVGAVIRPALRTLVPAAGQTLVGEVPGRAMCQVSIGVAKTFAEAQARERWTAARRHRDHARGPGVRLVG